MSFATVTTIINRVAIELGLASAAVGNPLSSTDPNFVLLRYLLNSLGERLVREYPWRHLKRTATLATVNGQVQYALAGDFQRMVENTQWNRSTDLPLTPLTSQGWQYVKAINIAAAPELLFRLAGGYLEIHPAPSGGQTIAYEYVTELWVIEPGETDPTNVEVASATDQPSFDTQVMVTGLKLAFREAKGLDTAAFQNAYDKALAAAQGSDTTPITLNLARPMGCAPGMPTTPWTNWGQT